MLDPRRLRTALAVDAVATVAAGLAVYARPTLVGALAPDRGPLSAFGRAATARRIGLAVAGFGIAKGVAYFVALARYGDSGRGAAAGRAD